MSKERDSATAFIAKILLHSGQCISARSRPGRAFGQPFDYHISDHTVIPLPLLQQMLRERLIASVVRESTIGGYHIDVVYRLTLAGRELAFKPF